MKVIFTTNPQKPMDEVLKIAGESLGVRYPHQIDRQKAISKGHAIQGWYLTTGGGGSILNSDPTLLGHVQLWPLWPIVIETGLNGGRGGSTGMVGVVIVIDTTKVAGSTIGSIADYAAMVSLTVAESPNHCDPLPSILDLMSSSCAGRDKPAGITAGDLAFLKALYFHNTGLGPTLSRDDIESNMKRQFKGE
ncbi:MAG TPA: hypothetical protein VGD63_01400 [Steroidobacteraceae bacterium]